MEVLLARIEYVLSGEVNGGTCSACDTEGSITISEDDGITCDSCGLDEPLPEAPSWV